MLAEGGEVWVSEEKRALVDSESRRRNLAGLIVKRKCYSYAGVDNKGEVNDGMDATLKCADCL